LTNLVYCQFRAPQTGQVQSAWAFGCARRQVGKRPGVTELQPQLGVVFAAASSELSETVKVGSIVKHQVAGLLGEAGIALHLADY
jgi:hypothetical protein